VDKRPHLFGEIQSIESYGEKGGVPTVGGGNPAPPGMYKTL